jgi:hypothetical protein
MGMGLRCSLIRGLRAIEGRLADGCCLFNLIRFINLQTINHRPQGSSTGFAYTEVGQVLAWEAYFYENRSFRSATQLRSLSSVHVRTLHGSTSRSRRECNVANKTVKVPCGRSFSYYIFNHIRIASPTDIAAAGNHAVDPI